jgi:hypothetical protein
MNKKLLAKELVKLAKGLMTDKTAATQQFIHGLEKQIRDASFMIEDAHSALATEVWQLGRGKANAGNWALWQETRNMVKDLIESCDAFVKAVDKHTK